MLGLMHDVQASSPTLDRSRQNSSAAVKLAREPPSCRKLVSRAFSSSVGRQASTVCTSSAQQKTRESRVPIAGATLSQDVLHKQDGICPCIRHVLEMQLKDAM